MDTGTGVVMSKETEEEDQVEEQLVITVVAHAKSRVAQSVEAAGRLS